MNNPKRWTEQDCLNFARRIMQRAFEATEDRSIDMYAAIACDWFDRARTARRHGYVYF